MLNQANTSAVVVVAVVGGGIAGTSCVESLFQLYDQIEPKYHKVVLISSSRLVKRATNIDRRGRNLEHFDVSQCHTDQLSSDSPDGLEFLAIQGEVLHIDPLKKIVVYRKFSEPKLQSEDLLSYNNLCLCIGSSPKQPQFLTSCSATNDEEIFDRLISLRDTATIEKLKSKLIGCKRLAIIGNGGISLELAAKLTNCSKVWIIRDKFIGTPFLDSGAAKFLLESASQNQTKGIQSKSSRTIYESTTSGNPILHDKSSEVKFGASLGPDWSRSIDFGQPNAQNRDLEIITDNEVVAISLNANNDHKLRLTTRSSAYFDCDLALLAVGVVPNQIKIYGDQSLDLSEVDGGIVIDDQMQTSIKGIYAAGDVVSCERWPDSDLWFQMRLWSQAKHMGHYAAQCIDANLSNEDPKLFFNFVCFTHCTSFFGYKLILLGRFNDQARKNREDQLEALVRVDPMKDYVKILVNPAGRIVGSILIGDTGLEETIENLIHDGLDVSEYKYELLNDRVDIEDYFD